MYFGRGQMESHFQINHGLCSRPFQCRGYVPCLCYKTVSVLYKVHDVMRPYQSWKCMSIRYLKSYRGIHCKNSLPLKLHQKVLKLFVQQCRTFWQRSLKMCTLGEIEITALQLTDMSSKLLSVLTEWKEWLIDINVLLTEVLMRISIIL